MADWIFYGFPNVSLNTMCLTILFFTLFPVKGDIKGLNLQWGHHIACPHINLVHGVTVTDCYRACLTRVKCKSFSYRARYKNCELCASDGATPGAIIVRSVGYVLSQKYKWKQSLQSSSCNCLDAEVCDVEDTNQPCKVAECPEPVGLNERVITQGNMRSVGSQMIYTCPAPDLQNGGGRATCDRNGLWSTVSHLSCSVYIGCFLDKPVRSLPHGPYMRTLMTNEICRDMCRALYGAVTKFYFASQYSRYCSCGIGYPNYPQTPEVDCRMRCGGDAAQVCGGSWRMSVYQTFQ